MHVYICGTIKMINRILHNKLRITMAMALTITILAFIGCKEETDAEDSAAITTDSTTYKTSAKDTGVKGQTSEEEMVDYYVLCLEKSNNYNYLDSLMLAAGPKTNLPIDTMNRYYNKKKKMIVLSDKDEDEMYRGEYAPRRFTGSFISIESYSYYQTEADQSMMCLIGGLFDKKEDAELLLNEIKETFPHSEVFHTRLYNGCIH